MRHNIIETIIAGAVILVAAAFLYFVLDRTKVEAFTSYPLEARFYDAPGLAKGAEIRIAGVTVGRVTDITLDMDRVEVIVAMEVQEGLMLPKDTRASIGYDGLLGDAVLVLHPGQASETFAPGERITKTSAPENVVDQIGHYVFGTGVGGDGF